MTKKLNIALIGATGAVGEAILAGLFSRKFPVNKLFPFASEKSVGNTISFAGKEYDLLSLENFDFADIDIAFFSAGSAVSKIYAPIAASFGCVVIDNTSFFRYDADVPLIIPEVNPERIADYNKRYIIANPNCSTIQMLVAIKPLVDAVGVHRINVATYQAVSGSGRKAIHALIHETTELLNGRSIKPQAYSHGIAFNVFPHIDDFQENGYTKEEMKMVWETQKILEDPDILVNPTTVRVPVFYGHSEALHLELKAYLSIEQIKKLLQKAPGVKLLDNPAKAHYPTPKKNSGSDDVFVGRIRHDISHPLGVNLWVVADNIRKGAATNAIQIAEILYQKYL